MKTNNIYEFKDIDDFLGDGSKRYFVTGYKKALREIKNVSVNSSEIIGVGNLLYNSSWSTKKEAPRKPHVSSMDALLFSLSLTEVFLTKNFKVDSQDILLTNFSIKPWKKPIEELQGIKLKAKYSIQEAIRLPSGKYNYIVDCVASVDEMIVKIKFTLRNSNKIENSESSFYSDIDEYLGDSRKNMYRYGHNAFLHNIKNVVVDTEALTTFSKIKVFKENSCELTGIGSNDQLSIVDGMIITLQLIQCLLYKLDGIRREDSNNLWMREMYFNQDCANNENVNNCKIFAKEIKLIGGKNELWRLATVEGNIANMTMQYKLAHKLPASVAL